MSTIDNYVKLKDTYPEMRKCFFAFGKEQFEEGKAKAGILPGEEVFHYRAGLYGTKEGLKEYFKELAAIRARIPKECDPQEVYDYEFANHECGFVHEDTDAIKVVAACFGEEAAKTVKRRYDWASIDELFNRKK
jgi:hypothetical protein